MHIQATEVHSLSCLLSVLELKDVDDPIEPTEDPLEPIPEGEFLICAPLQASCEREIFFNSYSGHKPPN